MKARFYGGPLDNQVRTLPPNTQRFEVPLIENMPPFDWERGVFVGTITDRPPILHRAIYIRQTRRVDQPDNVKLLHVPFVLEREI
jgi:hypothetical protein